MAKEHWVPPDAWGFVQENPGGYWEHRYRMNWLLEVHFEEEGNRWHCVARNEGAADGHREAYVDGDESQKRAAMQTCYELADNWKQNI